jgi:hypothetical protein
VRKIILPNSRALFHFAVTFFPVGRPRDVYFPGSEASGYLTLRTICSWECSEPPLIRGNRKDSAQLGTSDSPNFVVHGDSKGPLVHRARLCHEELDHHIVNRGRQT